MLTRCLKILASVSRQKQTFVATGLTRHVSKSSKANANVQAFWQRRGFAAERTAKCSSVLKTRAIFSLLKVTDLGCWTGQTCMSAWLALTEAQRTRAFSMAGPLKRFLLNSPQNLELTQQLLSKRTRASASWASRRQARLTYLQKLRTNGLMLLILLPNQTATFFAHITTAMI